MTATFLSVQGVGGASFFPAAPAKLAQGLRVGLSFLKAWMDRIETDWDGLLAAANGGDGRAFARFLVAVSPVLRRIVRARGATLPAHQHEDIVQDVLLAIHLKRHTWDPAQPVRPWLYAVCRHKIADAFRRRGSALHLPVEDFLEVLEGEAAPDPTAARDTATLLARIDARSAEIVRAISLDGESSQEVGQRLSMTDGAVRVAFHRAMRRLRDLAGGGGQ
jgi:RNA polymerase sigma factor (sigma-70 family)